MRNTLQSQRLRRYKCYGSAADFPSGPHQGLSPALARVAAAALPIRKEFREALLMRSIGGAPVVERSVDADDRRMPHRGRGEVA